MESGRNLMAARYFSRVRLKSDATVKALAPLLLGKEGSHGGDSTHTGHHLVWSLFADDGERERDFLWREMGRGEYFLLSARPPEDRHGLFDIAEPKRFAPKLAPGDKLGFSLRANPVVRRQDPVRGRTIKHDVVMNALRLREGKRAEQRWPTIQEQGLAWLSRQGERAGFRIEPRMVRVDGYEQHRVPRKSAEPMLYSTVDYDGVLTVTAPVGFLDAVTVGFGSAKAYGCGLMLIRRVAAE